MTNDRHGRISEIFLEVCELSPADASRRLDAICADDPELRPEIDALLRHDETEALVDQPIPAQLFDGLTRHPERIGPYEIVSVLGRGGMGTVYRARQTHPDRAVALKVIRTDMSSPTLLRRFEHEAQVLGRLRHPGIAQIYEAGTADAGHGPQPYFALELVDGRRLDEFLRDEDPTLADRVELMATICDAVHHAHVRGIIHRDIKPGNVLVDVQGQPRVLDFGVARVTDSDIRATTLQTNVGQLVGTVPYMSPEQIAGDPNDLDVRSDVYALGVVLFESLAGRLPYDLETRTIPEAVRIILDQDADRLSSIDRVYRGDLDTIVAKALEKDRDRRYQSAAELAADLRRYVRSEPIEARPATTAYQLKKFAQRNRALVGAVGAVLTVLVAALIVTSVFAARARDQRDKAIVAQTSAQEENERFKAVNGFLNWMLHSASPFSDIPTARVDMPLSEVLARADQDIEERLGDQPLIASDVHRTVGVTYRQLGRLDDAEKHLVRAVDLARCIEDPPGERTSVALREYGRMLTAIDRYDESQAALTEAADILLASSGPDDPDLMLCHAALGLLYKEQEAFDEAEEHIRRAIELIDLQGAKPHDVATLKNNLAGILQRTGRTDEAIALYDEAAEIFRTVYGENHATILTLENNIAYLLHDTDRASEAADRYDRVVDIARSVMGERHPQFAVFLNNAGMVRWDLGELDRAEVCLRETLDIYREIHGEDHAEYIGSLNNYALVLLSGRRAEDAAAAFRQVQEFRRRDEGEDAPRTLLAGLLAARCMAIIGDCASHETSLLAAFERLDEICDNTNVYLRAGLKYVRDFYIDCDQADAADPYATRFDTLQAAEEGS